MKWEQELVLAMLGPFSLITVKITIFNLDPTFIELRRFKYIRLYAYKYFSKQRSLNTLGGMNQRFRRSEEKEAWKTMKEWTSYARTINGVWIFGIQIPNRKSKLGLFPKLTFPKACTFVSSTLGINIIQLFLILIWARFSNTLLNFVSLFLIQWSQFHMFLRLNICP